MCTCVFVAFILLKIFTTLLQNTPEQLFSILSRVKTYLKNAIGRSRLNRLANEKIHREIQINEYEVLDYFFPEKGATMRYDNVINNVKCTVFIISIRSLLRIFFMTRQKKFNLKYILHILL